MESEGCKGQAVNPNSSKLVQSGDLKFTQEGTVDEKCAGIFYECFHAPDRHANTRCSSYIQLFKMEKFWFEKMANWINGQKLWGEEMCV